MEGRRENRNWQWTSFLPRSHHFPSRRVLCGSTGLARIAFEWQFNDQFRQYREQLLQLESLRKAITMSCSGIQIAYWTSKQNYVVDLVQIQTILDKKKFLMGEEPTAVRHSLLFDRIKICVNSMDFLNLHNSIPFQVDCTALGQFGSAYFAVPSARLFHILYKHLIDQYSKFFQILPPRSSRILRIHPSEGILRQSENSHLRNRILRTHLILALDPWFNYNGFSVIRHF